MLLPDVCLSITSWSLLDALSWFLAQIQPPTYPTLCYKGIWVTSEIRVLSGAGLPRLSWKKAVKCGVVRSAIQNVVHCAV